MNRGRIDLITAVFFVCFIALNSVYAVDFNGGLVFQYYNGQEVDPRIQADFPHNRVFREYFEGFFRGEFLFNRLPYGDRLRLGVRMLELQPSNVDEFLYQMEYERRYLDKVYAQFVVGDWEIWSGDVYETFGRGLVLNLFENRDLYFDSGLRGGKVCYRTKRVRFKAIYGRSREWYLVKDENVGGLNFEFRPRRELTLGASVVHQEGLSYEEHFLPEVYAGYEFYPFAIYGEYAQKWEYDFRERTGSGLFASLTAATAGVAAQLNYKYYKFGEENPFSTPPICQREYTTKLLSTHPHIPYIDDQMGYELDISASPWEELYFNLNLSQSSRQEGASLLPSLKQDYAPFREIFIECEYYARRDLTVKVGLGWNEEARNNFWQKKTGSMAEAIYNISDLWSVTWLLERMWVDDVEFKREFAENYQTLTLSRAPYGSITFSYENSSYYSHTEGDEWIGGEIALNIKSKHRLVLFYGRERGGLKCTSGVCRPVQPFEGFKITYEGRF